ncbi:uncharacterized protein MELLADRAFT_70762 [Melampsora larici-populina 98AG31]|uniref:Mediator of RNA polymerase II transcription subunit 21 n=1 Tax=Melampsora larici-populina (strain 98AG31 / pathotype 3-4-7) TaxID=747676 RepID=F4R7N8_MELLP|nr:uncharacterized protein MELLADRAFT_70762 [Melampsora larici-populina 98AG31]EGG11349.1 hypothetical protein MELLADRAFT_70762 [Melampsora larici-populina 98AG31]
MTSHDDELSRNMDRITQLQDGIDNLVTIMYSTVSYLSRKADFEQVNPDIPITQSISDPTKIDQAKETFNQNCQELVEDFIRKAKQLEYLISILPPHDDSSTIPLPNTTDPPQATSSSLSSSPTNHNRVYTISSSTCTEPDGTKVSSPITKPTNGEISSDQNHSVDEDDELGTDKDEFNRLQRDIEDAQAEYEHALSIAESLHSEIKSILKLVLEKRSQSGAMSP